MLACVACSHLRGPQHRSFAQILLHWSVTCILITPAHRGCASFRNPRSSPAKSLKVGYIVPEYFRWPGFLSPEKGLKFADMPHGIAAISKAEIGGRRRVILAFVCFGRVLPAVVVIAAIATVQEDTGSMQGIRPCTL